MGDTRGDHKVWVIKDRFGRTHSTVTRGSQLSRARKLAKTIGGHVELFVPEPIAGLEQTIAAMNQPVKRYGAPVFIPRNLLQDFSGPLAVASTSSVPAFSSLLTTTVSQMEDNLRVQLGRGLWGSESG